MADQDAPATVAPTEAEPAPTMGAMVQGATQPMVSGLTLAQQPTPTVPVDPSMRVRVRFGDKLYTVPAANYASSLEQGGQPVSDEEWTAHLAKLQQEKELKERRDKYGGIGSQLETGAVGALSGLTVGMSDVAIGGAASAATKERLRQEAAENPYVHGAAKFGGMLLPLAFSDGAAAPLEAAAGARAAAAGVEGGAALRAAAEGAEAATGAAEASGAVQGAQQAATAARGIQATSPSALASAGRILAAPQHLVTKVGEGVERGIASLISRDAQGLAGELAAKAIATGARGVAEGGIQGGADYLSEQALSKDPELDGQKFAASIGMGALWGGAGGGLLGAGGGLLHAAANSGAGEAVLSRVKREANELVARAGTQGRQTGAGKKLFDLPHEGYANGADALGDYLLKNLPPEALAGKTVTDIQKAVEPLVEKEGQAVGAIRSGWDSAGVEGVKMGRLNDILDEVKAKLDPFVHAPAIAEIEGIKGYIQRTAEAGTLGRAAAREAADIEASGAVKAAKSAENSAINNVENARRAHAAAEAQELAAASNAITATDKLEAMKVARAEKAAAADALSTKAPTSPKEYKEFMKTPEGLAKAQEFLERTGRDPRGPADLFPKVDQKAAKGAARAAQVADADVARAEAQAAKAQRLADTAKADKAARLAEVDGAAAKADAARMARTAAEETAAKQSNAAEKVARETPLTFDQLGKVRATIDDKIKGWNRDTFGDANLKTDAMKKVRWALEDEIVKAGDEGMKKLGIDGAGDAYGVAKLNYRKALLANEMFTKSAISRGKNATASLTDQLIGGFASHLAGGPLGIVTGIAGAAVHKAIRERGLATAAVVLDKISALSSIRKATERVDSQIDAGVAAILGHGSPKKVGGPPSHGLGSFEEKKEAITEAMKELQAKGGQGTVSSAMAAVAGLAPHAPNIASSFQTTATRAIAYLASTMPQSRPVNPAQPLAAQIEPTDHAKRTWSRQVDALHAPVSIMAKAANGTLTAEENQAVATVMPPLHKAMVAKTKAAIQTSPKPLSYKALTGASTLVGMPMDPTLANVGYFQGTWTPPPAPPAIGTPPKRERSNAKAGKMHFAESTALKGSGFTGT